VTSARALEFNFAAALSRIGAALPDYEEDDEPP
jgi:hypothetical protein